MEELLSRVEATLKKFCMLVPGERILVACSGGRDSVALFTLFKALAPRLKIRLGLVHFDHALRKNSTQDVQFVERLARKTKTPFYGGRRDLSKAVSEKGFSPEEAARNLRYDFFKKVSQKTGAFKIALGHHRDDQAETVLMRILQGTGLRGLQGIRPVVKIRGVTFIRPLIEISREEIQKFLRREKIPFREDGTNRSERFLRNRIRRRLLPWLEKEFNPKIRVSLCRLAETTTNELAGLDSWVKSHHQEFLRSRRNGKLTLARKSFLSLPTALQFRVLDEILRILHPTSGLDFDAWERISQGFKTGRFRITLPRDVDLHLTPRKLTLQRFEQL